MTASEKVGGTVGIVNPTWRIAEQDAVSDVALRVGHEVMELTSTDHPPLTWVKVDEEALSLLPARQCQTVLSTKDPAEVQANDLASRRFFKRVDGRDLRQQLEGQTHPSQEPAWYRWMAAPIDPLLPEEAATVGVGFDSHSRSRDRQRLYVKNQVRPVGMTLERAIAIAQAAQDAIDNDTAPTHA